MTQLDALLGADVVYSAPNGSLRLNQVALDAQRHRAHPERRMRCWCPACKADRDRKPEPAKPQPKQPWEARPGQDDDELDGQLKFESAVAASCNESFQPQPTESQ